MTQAERTEIVQIITRGLFGLEFQPPSFTLNCAYALVDLLTLLIEDLKTSKKERDN